MSLPPKTGHSMNVRAQFSIMTCRDIKFHLYFLLSYVNSGLDLLTSLANCIFFVSGKYFAGCSVRHLCGKSVSTHAKLWMNIHA
jgi:hypothetical protein